MSSLNPEPRRSAMPSEALPGDARPSESLAHDSIAMAITTPDGRWLWVGAPISRLLGYADGELIGRSFESLTHPDHVPQTLELLRHVAGGAGGGHAETRLIHKRGHPIWVTLDLGAARDENGEARCLVARFRNDTGRKVAEAALREEANHSRGIGTNAPGIVYQYAYRPDGAKGFTFVSDGVRALFGVSPEAVVQDPSTIFDLIHPDDRATFYESGGAAVATLTPWHWEGRVLLPTGEERYIRAASRNERQPDGTVLADGLLMDVTDERRTAVQLEESEQRYRSLFVHHPDAVFSLDLEGGFRSANPACETISGYRPEELVGTSFAPLMVPEQLDAAFRHFRGAVAGTAQSYETAIQRKDGHRVEIDVTNIPMVVGGEVVGVFGIAKDLTARYALEAKLRQAQKMETVGQLAGGVAHDFNNILSAIAGFAELLHASFDAHDPRRKDVEEILKGTRRGSGLTRQLLAFSRKQVLQPVTLDLNQLVTETAMMLRPLLGAALQVVTKPADAPVPVVADRTQLEQVLINLAVNARDAMPDGGTLTISVGVTRAQRDTPAAATLVVSDTGVGMTKEVLARAFEPFFTTKPVGKGTGLGLSTVHGVVQQSGGTIRIASAPGAGATFTVTLPLAEAVRATDSAVATPSVRGVGTVLLVEDEAPLRVVAQRVLQRAGYQVLVAGNGAEALRVLDESDVAVDVLLSDVTMPELGGVDLAAIAVERVPGIRVVLMSGYADADVGVIGQGNLVDAFVSKPFTTASLLDAVQGAVHSER